MGNNISTHFCGCCTMDTFKVVNNTVHVKVGSQFRVRSNFTLALKWEIYHPSDTGYVVDLTREDNVQG